MHSIDPAPVTESIVDRITAICQIVQYRETVSSWSERNDTESEYGLIKAISYTNVTAISLGWLRWELPVY